MCQRSVPPVTSIVSEKLPMEVKKMRFSWRQGFSPHPSISGRQQILISKPRGEVHQMMDPGLTEWLLFQSRVIYLQSDTLRKERPFSQQPPGGLA